jgi:hypothetical protein
MLGKTFVQWGDEWAWVDDRTGKWWGVLNGSFTIRFVESATEDDISNFIQSNNLRIDHKFDEYYYILRLNDPIHIIDFLISQQYNPLIQDAMPDTIGCAGI